MGPLHIVLTIGLIARGTWLIVGDSITQPVRDKIAERSEDWFFFLSCASCVSVWISALTIVAYYHHTNPIFVIVAVAATASYVVGLLESWRG